MSKNITTENKFLTGKIFPTLISFAIPMLLALFLQALYGAVDLWAVSKFAHDYSISAVSTGSQIMLIINGFVTGIFMGTSIILSRKIGEGDKEASSSCFGQTVLILGVLSIIVTVFLLTFSKGIISLAKVPTEAVGEAISYLRICGAGTVFIAGYCAISSVFRGIGNSKAPLGFVFIACIINIICDIVFIKNFKLGASGAAMATVLSQAVSLILSLLYLKIQPIISKTELPFEISIKYFKPNKLVLGKIVSLGLPIALSDTLNEICYLIIISLTNTLGVTASAGVGVAEKLIVFLLLVPMTYVSALSSFVSQNIGAGKKDRAKGALFSGLASATVLGFVFSYILFFHGQALALIFNKDSKIIASAAIFLKATSLECLILSIANCFTGYLSGLGKTRFVMLQGVLSVLLVKIPYAVLALKLTKNKLFQIGLSTVFGATFTLLASMGYYFYLEKQNKRKI